MDLQSVGPYPHSFHNKVVRDLAALLLPLPPLASSAKAKANPTMPSTNSCSSSSNNNNSHQADDTAATAAADPPPAKRRKTVDFSSQVEMCHVDEDDGSILSVETRDLHSPQNNDDDDDDDNDDGNGVNDETAVCYSPARPRPGRLNLDKAARDIDKNLFFSSQNGACRHQACAGVPCGKVVGLWQVAGSVGALQEGE
jgi:hypothetical protein